MITYKIVIIGTENIGKSEFLKKCKVEKKIIEEKYSNWDSQFNVTIYNSHLKTNDDIIKLEIWDCEEITEEICTNSDAIIFMYDFTYDLSKVKSEYFHKKILTFIKGKYFSKMVNGNNDNLVVDVFQKNRSTGFPTINAIIHKNNKFNIIKELIENF